MHPDLLEGDGVGSEFPSGLFRQLAGVTVGGRALHGAEAAMGARRAEESTVGGGGRRGSVGVGVGGRGHCRAHAVARPGRLLSRREPLRVGEVEGGREVELGRGTRRPRVGGGSEARRAGLRAGRRGLLVVGQSAGLAAVGEISHDLLVAGQAVGVSPELKGHCG